MYADGTVEFRHGDKLYGPYTAREDPSAIPDADEEGELLGGESVTGVELRCKGEILSADASWIMGTPAGCIMRTERWKIFWTFR